MESMSLDNPVFRVFLGHSVLVLFKTCLMSVITVAVYYGSPGEKTINKDDAGKGVRKNKKSEALANVERVRRCHLNDLENVIPFVILGLLYVATGPDIESATIRFRIFTISRFFHTIFYLFAIPQPTRFLAFLAGFAINISMIYRILIPANF
ncbi:unnamed protein product [Lymnaea stagnalis]|uniref:Microsomal glutathione S-transferase 1 n=1 Tax=Lymnaea stagnalis TaxID=6523 RepID=A0AAV2HTJ6_LYMST